MGDKWAYLPKCEKTDLAPLEQKQHLGCTKAIRQRRIPRNSEIRFKTHKRLDDTTGITSYKP